MDKFKLQIRMILGNDCLSETERNELKHMFKQFLRRRDIASRKTVDKIENIDFTDIDNGLFCE